MRFQSLGRDSVRSNRFEEAGEIRKRGVSIPRSGFCPFKHGYLDLFTSSTICFNPSVGILSVQTHSPRTSPPSYHEFQSLGRDSVRSNPLNRSAYPPTLALVSIPRSGFCPFKLLTTHVGWRPTGRSISPVRAPPRPTTASSEGHHMLCCPTKHPIARASPRAGRPSSMAGSRTLPTVLSMERMC